MTESGRRVAGVPPSSGSTVRDEFPAILADGVERHLRGEGGIPIVPLLRRAALSLQPATQGRFCDGVLVEGALSNEKVSMKRGFAKLRG